MIIHSFLTPEYRKIAKTIEVSYGSYQSPFGIANIAIITKPMQYAGSVCFIAFAEDHSFLAALTKAMPLAKLFKDNDLIKSYGGKIFITKEQNLPLFLQGTEMQMMVWQALIESKPCQEICYEDIAKKIDRKKAVRAVATAVGRNPISFLIPCHRILRKSGAIGGYRWGVKLKQDLLEYEAGDS